MKFLFIIVLIQVGVTLTQTITNSYCLIHVILLLQKNPSAFKIFLYWFLLLLILLTLLALAILLYVKFAPKICITFQQNGNANERNSLDDEVEENTPTNEETNQLERQTSPEISPSAPATVTKEPSNKPEENNTRNATFAGTTTSAFVSIVELYRKNKSQQEIEEFLYGKSLGSKCLGKESSNQLFRIVEETDSSINNGPSYIESTARGWLKIQARKEHPPSRAWNNESFMKDLNKNNTALVNKFDNSNKKSRQKKNFLRTLKF